MSSGAKVHRSGIKWFVKEVKNLFYGQHRHGIDAKGRIIFPSKFREELGEIFYVTQGVGKFLLVYPENEWKVLESKLKSLPMSKGMAIQRFFFGNAAEVSADKQGRVNVPQSLRSYAFLDKDIVIVGMSDHIEIWDVCEFDKMNSSPEISPEEISAQMELLGI